MKLNHDPQFDHELPERVEFVRHAIRVALKDRKLNLRGHVHAAGLCRVMLELAVDHFAESGKDELIRWGFGSSEQLGSVIHELAVQGVIELTEMDTLSAFAGWYDLAVDPKNWALSW